MSHNISLETKCLANYLKCVHLVDEPQGLGVQEGDSRKASNVRVYTLSPPGLCESVSYYDKKRFLVIFSFPLSQKNDDKLFLLYLYD